LSWNVRRAAADVFGLSFYVAWARMTFEPFVTVPRVLSENAHSSADQEAEMPWLSDIGCRWRVKTRLCSVDYCTNRYRQSHIR